MLRQFLEVKEAHPDKLVLFRMGDFYETFFEDAKTASRILGITLTARNKNDENPIPLAGFPYHALKNYMDKLVQNNMKVVICEQIEDPKLAKGIVKRDITEIITPGAILDTQYIEKNEFNYLAAVYKSPKKDKTGIAGIDISTGEFIFTEVFSELAIDEIQRINPAEIVVCSKEDEERIKNARLNPEPVISMFDHWNFDVKETSSVLLNHFKINSLESLGAKNKPCGATAAALALSYVKSLKKEELKHISNLRFYHRGDYMMLDEVSRRNLELTKSMRYNSKQGSLLSVIDKTQTPMGSRLLSSNLISPLLNQRKIEDRLDAVEELKNQIILNEDLREILKEIGDLSRIISKVGTKRINPREVIALGNYLSAAPRIIAVMNNFKSKKLKTLYDNIFDYNDICSLIKNSVIDNPSATITDGNIIRDGFNNELDDLRSVSRDGKSWIARLETEEKKQTGIPSLKIGYNKVFGYYLEVTKTHKDKIPEHYIRKQTLVNSERYISPQLKEYENKVLGAEERIKNLEHEIFTLIREQLYENIEIMQQYVSIVAEIDVLSNLAHIAYNRNYCRPVFNDKDTLEIIDGRHPVIETMLKSGEFIPNDVSLNGTDCLIALITGPNMAGKSTYLRQTGLLAIMAQLGSFVPAKSASMPIFDKVFTRVGASDNLAQGQSTFLVEMIETANILNSATKNSLILLDEIGRGTSTFDGLSLAWSIVEYIHNQKRLRSKTLFATHYHELTELEYVLSGVKNFNIAVREWNDEMIFLRKIERGDADQSYGIQVARLAGVPDKVVKRAKQILANLEQHELSPQGLTKKIKKQLSQLSPQMDIFEVMIEKSEEKNEIIEEIKNADLDNMTPKDAMRFLIELQQKIEED
ncbi:MAG: DNA mismatch repair protein MutS [Candidatus Cloacimonadota bacterium]|nr:MAG: DNA mismatch repair protein MutS [Candidatus Cloacimonadota bacterium]